MYRVETSTLNRLHETFQKSLLGATHPTASRCHGNLPLPYIQRQSTLELRVSEQGQPDSLLTNASCEGSLVKSVKAIHIVIGIDPFASDETKMIRDTRFLQIPELIIRKSSREHLNHYE